MTCCAPVGGCSRFVDEETRRWVEAGDEQGAIGKTPPATAVVQTVDGQWMVCLQRWREKHAHGLRVGLRIRCAGRARVSESRGGREAIVRYIHLANAEGATAAVMQYGYQRGEIFEGCERADWEGT
jgi:hypothetical protein